MNNRMPVPMSICKLFMSPKKRSDAAVALVSGASQLMVLLYLMARMWGDEDRKLGWVRISVAEIAGETGLPANTVADALSDLVARGLVEASKRGCAQTYSHGLKPDGWDALKGAAIDYRVDAAWWLNCPAYDPDVKEPEQPEAEEAEPEQAEAPAAFDHGVLASGRSARYPASVSCKEAPNGASIHLACRNRVGVPMRIETRTLFGEISVTLHPFVETTQTSRVDRGGLPVKPIVINKAKLGKPRDADLDAVAALRREHFNEPRDDAFSARVLKCLDGAPVEQLATQAAREIPVMRAKRKPVVTGILLFFAERVGAAWREAAAEREAEKAGEALRANDRRRLIGPEELQRMAASSDPIEREYARQVLEAEAGLGV